MKWSFWHTKLDSELGKMTNDDFISFISVCRAELYMLAMGTFVSWVCLFYPLNKFFAKVNEIFSIIFLLVGKLGYTFILPWSVLLLMMGITNYIFLSQFSPNTNSLQFLIIEPYTAALGNFDFSMQLNDAFTDPTRYYIFTFLMILFTLIVVIIMMNLLITVRLSLCMCNCICTCVWPYMGNEISIGERQLGTTCPFHQSAPTTPINTQILMDHYQEVKALARKNRCREHCADLYR